MAHAIDSASFKALEEGWVTSAGILVPGPWFPEVQRWARSNPNVSLGLQLDLNSDWSSYRWRPVSGLEHGSGLTDDGGYLASTELYVAHHARPEEVEGETRAQVDLAKRAGIPITYLDTHMRTMLVTPALFQSYWKMGNESGAPLLLPIQLVRSRGTATQKPGVYQFGGLEVDTHKLLIDKEIEIMPGFAAKDWLKAYESALVGLPAGTYVLSVHLAYNDEEMKAMTFDHPNWGAQWRQNDYDVISSAEFRQFLKDQNFTLVSWKDLEKLPAAAQW